jgi:hypothetical protein
MYLPTKEMSSIQFLRCRRSQLIQLRDPFLWGIQVGKADFYRRASKFENLSKLEVGRA